MPVTQGVNKMECTITLPDTFTVSARKDAVTVNLDVTKLSAELIAKAALHGLKQKIADGAANAKMNACVAIAGNKKEGEAEAAYTKRLTEAAAKVTFAEIDAEAKRLMAKVVTTLESGSWGVERGEGEAELDLAPIAYAMTVYGAKLKTDIAGYADMKMADRRKAVDAWLDAKDGRRATIVTKVAEERAAAMDI